MNPFWKLLPLKSWLILATVVFGLLALLSWRSACMAVETAREEATLASSRMGSAETAIDIIGNTAEADEATRNQVEEAENAIRSETDPVRRDAVARRELCKLQRPGGPC